MKKTIVTTFYFPYTTTTYLPPFIFFLVYKEKK